MHEKQCFYQRYELKYLIDTDQYHQLLTTMNDYMVSDTFAHSSIRNLYLDTPDYRLIKTSLGKPVYKEKLRLRSYGPAMDQMDVYIELKKKYKGVVYKRRMLMDQPLSNGGFNQPVTSTSQIGRELNYVFSYYHALSPRVFLAYERDSYQGKADTGLRITFDTDMVYRDSDLSFDRTKNDRKLMRNDRILMEVKTVHAMPLWLAHWLNGHAIYQTSFSKYGMAYLSLIEGRTC